MFKGIICITFSCSEMEVFSRYHPVPFSKMLTFYRKEPFTLEARYSSPQDIPLDTQKIGVFAIISCIL